MIMKKTLTLYQVDAFTDRIFAGNPAAVCIMDKWLDDDIMQSVANENNLSETAFLVPNKDGYVIRWFTPAVEVDLCGHATLASAYVLFDILGYSGEVLKLTSPRSGLLKVSKKNDVFYMDFPTDSIHLLDNDAIEAVYNAIGVKPIEVYKGNTDLIAIVEDETTLKNLKLDFGAIENLKARGLTVSAKGDEVDFVSRFFAPQVGIKEDPVTGSAHTSLLPIWSNKLDKTKFTVKQISKRGGALFCYFKNERCLIGGKAKLYFKGKIYF